MKKIMLIVVLFLVACGVPDSPQYYVDDESPTWGTVTVRYHTFEEALLEDVTDIVIVQYVGSRPYGERMREFEFMVSERILGDATDRIIVRTWINISAGVGDHEGRSVHYIPGDLTFTAGNDYLLPLSRIDPIFTNSDDIDRFMFVLNLKIDLEDLPSSMMYSEPLDYHVVGMSINEATSTQDVISFIKELAEQIGDQRWETVLIRSELMEDIIKGSPYVLVVEVNGPVLLAREMSPTGEGVNDVYNITVIQSLKGGVEVGEDLVVSFFANTVHPGEQHIVAVQPLSEDYHYWFIFTSSNSLFRLDQLEEIMLILDNDH